MSCFSYSWPLSTRASMLLTHDIQILSLVKIPKTGEVLFELDHDGLKDRGDSNGYKNYMKSHTTTTIMFHGLPEP